MTNIIGIGSRAAGLSTYLATLAYHQKHQVKSKKVLSCQVTPSNPSARNLSDQAENILKKQLMLDDLFSDIGGYFLPIDGKSHREDGKYSDSLEKFTTDLTQRNPQGCPIAFAVTKCDLSELWVNRDDPRGLVQRRFPKMYAILENWTQEYKGKVEYFTTSSFGVFGQYCDPNSIIQSKSKEGTSAVIRNPQEWQPFGLIEPLYWLCTGKML